MFGSTETGGATGQADFAGALIWWAPGDGSGEDKAQAGQDVGSTTSSTPVSTGKSRRRVMIVEDEFIISMELEHMLSDAGFEVVGIADDAAGAVLMAQEHRPDFVTMDVSLAGDRDGVSAAIEIFERFGVRSVFVSAYTDQQTKERARPASPYGWLAKPLFRSRFERALQSLLADPDAN